MGHPPLYMCSPRGYLLFNDVEASAKNGRDAEHYFPVIFQGCICEQGLGKFANLLPETCVS